MLSKLVRALFSEDYDYIKKCRKYVYENEIKVLKLLSSWETTYHVLTEKDLSIVEDVDFPINNKISKSNSMAQIVSFLQAIGVDINFLKKGVVSFEGVEDYHEIVNNHLKFTGKGLVSNLGTFCEYANGKISYDTMEMILGKHFPKASYIKYNDRKWEIIFFLKEVGLLFAFDKEYIYFP